MKTTRNDINKIRLKYLIKFFPFLFIAVFFKIDDFQNIFRNSLNISQTRNLELRPLDEFLSESRNPVFDFEILLFFSLESSGSILFLSYGRMLNLGDDRGEAFERGR